MNINLGINMSIKIPLLPLRDIVAFPGIVIPLYVGRKSSLKALEIAKQDQSTTHTNVLLAAQKDQTIDDPQAKDLYSIGVIARVMQFVRLPNDNVKVLVEGLQRVKISDVKFEDGYFSASCETLLDGVIEDIDMIAHKVAGVIEKFATYAKLNKKINPEIFTGLNEQKNPVRLVNIIASHLTIKMATKQQILEIEDLDKRIDFLEATLDMEIELLNTEKVVQERVKKQMEKSQRDYYLNEQMKAIQKELGDGSDKTDITEFEDKIKKLKLSPEAKEKAQAELKKLKSMNPMAAEASVSRNYLEVLLSMPWGKYDKSSLDIAKAQAILNRDHYGLEKVKERIVEYLAVLKRTRKIKGPIICFVGPPGVGKTSLAKSIAEALGRQYTKFALGGVKDESEIRGHRKTYLGSMPGKVLNLLRKAKTSNPVMLLDEIDKMSSDFRGDPTSALLEVLDPEQNNRFVDHYLEVEYDLSDVLFIATANSLNLPQPLLDRMEIIRIAGYIEAEKMHIARDYLIPKQIKEHGLKESEFSIDDDALLDLIRYYTKEAGVRNLDRMIASLARKSLKKILEGSDIKSVAINPKNLKDFLGAQKYKFGQAEAEDFIGVTNGLAYTDFGGDLLAIEAVKLPGKGEIKATGKLGDVMKESAQAAFSYFKSKANEYNIPYEEYKDFDIHLHVPEGAIPKDGPSAGIAILTTIFSVIKGLPVKQTIAMTGEITLRGRVLPIGGLKEKLLAAARGGIKTVLIPIENVKDLEDIPEDIKKNLYIRPVTTAEEVIEEVFGLKNEKESKSQAKPDGKDPKKMPKLPRKDIDHDGDTIHTTSLC